MATKKRYTPEKLPVVIGGDTEPLRLLAWMKYIEDAIGEVGGKTDSYTQLDLMKLAVQAYSAERVSESLDRVARKLGDLGTGDAATSMGAIELLSGEVKSVAAAINEVASAIQQNL